MSRLTTAEGVLETIYSLAGIASPFENDEPVFRGHPLAALPKGAAIVFYGIWPAVVILSRCSHEGDGVYETNHVQWSCHVDGNRTGPVSSCPLTSRSSSAGNKPANRT